MGLPQGYQPPPLTVVPSAVELAHRELDMTNPTDREYTANMVAQGSLAAQMSWLNYRRIGEVRYAVARSAKIAGYTELRGVRVDTGGQVIGEAGDGSVVAEIVAGIYSRFGGTRGLMERYYTLRKVLGEAYLMRLRESEDVDGYWFLSPSEISSESVTPYVTSQRAAQNKDITWVTSRRHAANGNRESFQRRIQSRDFLGRIWQPDGEYLDDADSPMQSINDMCEMLHMLTENIKGRLQQRFALAGILLIPNEISDAAISGEMPKGNLYSTDKVLNYLIHVMTRNVMRHDSPIAQVPILLKGPADVLEKVRHLVLDQQVHETDLKLRGELIQRILDALDQQKQAVQGGEGTNHWGMWAVSDEERRITVQPDIEAACHAFTRMILWRELKERKWTAGRIRPWRVWYDLSSAAVKSNMGEDVRQAWDRGWVDAEYARGIMGAKSTDALEGDEYVRWVGIKTSNEYLACYGLEGVDVDWEQAALWGSKSGPPADSPADPEEVGPSSSGGGPDDRDSDTPKSEEPG